MSVTKSRRSGLSNRLLATLPPNERKRFLALLEPVSLAVGQVLQKARKPVAYAYFPTSGVASALALMEDGTTIEVGTIGNEGVVGAVTYFGFPGVPNEVVVQVKGDALRVAADTLVREARRDGRLRDTLIRYHTYALFEMSQSVACNGLHSVHQRCCRWLLITHDRLPTDDLPLTDEFLATMLGVRRASVTLVLHLLQDRGLVRGGRGTIRVVNRKALEVAACECYQKDRDEYDRLLG